MVFGKYLLVLFFTAIILACVNMFGYGFSKPIEISFELKANSSTETKIFYRTSEDDSYIDGRSVSYLIAPNAKEPEQYTKTTLQLNNVRHVEAIRVVYEANNDNFFCYKNVEGADKLSARPIYLLGGIIDGLEIDNQNNSQEICFTLSKEMSNITGVNPSIEVRDLDLDAPVDYYSYWQIVLAIGIFLMLLYVTNLFWEVIFNKKFALQIPGNLVIYQLIVLSTVLYIVLFIISEILTSYNVHEMNLMILSCGLIGLRFLIAIKKTFIVHAHFWLVFLLLILLMLIRYAVFKENVGTIYSSEFYGYLHIVKQDLPFDVVAVLLLSLAYYVERKSIKFLAFVVVLVELAIIFSDYAINTHDRAERLIFSQFADFSWHQVFKNYLEVVIRYFQTSQGFLTCASIFIFITLVKNIFFNKNKELKLKLSWIRLCSYIVLAGISVWLYFLNIGTSSVYDDKFYNTVAINNSLENTDFSRLSAFTTESFYVKKGLNSNKNVVVLMVDSLSSFKSKLYGGEDFMPKLDSIAKKNAYFSNFYATAYNNEIALLGLLTGKPYLHNNSDLTSPLFYETTIPKELKKRGYNSIIMYSAQPSATERVQFEQLGFDFLVDYRDEFYSPKAPRYLHGSVDTKLFLENAATKIDYWINHNKMKIFATLVSSFSSSPYQVPIEFRSNPTKVEYDLNRVTLFNDDAIAKFVEDLDKRGYFKNGALIITGNHRAQVSLTKEEYDKYGLIAITRVPCIVIDHDLPKDIHAYNNDLSTLSLSEIIYYLTVDEYRGSSMRVNPFVDFHNDELIIYQKTAPRNVILLKKGDTTGQFYINGNKSKIVGNLYDKDTTFGDVLYLLKEQVYNTDTLTNPKFEKFNYEEAKVGGVKNQASKAQWKNSANDKANENASKEASGKSSDKVTSQNKTGQEDESKALIDAKEQVATSESASVSTSASEVSSATNDEANEVNEDDNLNDNASNGITIITEDTITEDAVSNDAPNKDAKASSK